MSAATATACAHLPAVEPAAAATTTDAFTAAAATTIVNAHRRQADLAHVKIRERDPAPVGEPLLGARNVCRGR